MKQKKGQSFKVSRTIQDRTVVLILVEGKSESFGKLYDTFEMAVVLFAHTSVFKSEVEVVIKWGSAKCDEKHTKRGVSLKLKI